MVNPFEDETGQFLVLVNSEGQYSLWPAFSCIAEGVESYRSVGRASGVSGLDRGPLDRHATKVARRSPSCGESITRHLRLMKAVSALSHGHAKSA